MARGPGGPGVLRIPQSARLELLACVPEAPKEGAPALLFIHGAFAGAWCWAEHFLPWFARAGWRAYALSLRAHGGSPLPAGMPQDDPAHPGASIADYVTDLAEAVGVVAALEGGAPALIGHSMGGFVALKYIEGGARVPALALMASAPPQGLLGSQMLMAMRSPAYFSELNQALNAKSADFAQGSADLYGRILFATRPAPEDLARWQRLSCPESQRAVWDMTLGALPNPFALQAALRGLRLGWFAPGADALIAIEQQRIGAQLLGCQPEVFEGMGHALMLERGWERVAQRVSDWLAGG